MIELIRTGQPLSFRQRLWLTVQLSWPAIMAQLSSILMQYIDAAMVGRLGADRQTVAPGGGKQRRRRAELRAKIKACEDEMEACGAREVELDNEINSPEVYNDPDLLRQKSDELSDLRFHQEELFAAWEAAMEEQEAYEQTQQPEE